MTSEERKLFDDYCDQLPFSEDAIKYAKTTLGCHGCVAKAVKIAQMDNHPNVTKNNCLYKAADYVWLNHCGKVLKI